VGRNAAEAPIDALELTGVQAAADVESERLDLPNDRRSGLQRSRRSVECGEEAVAGGVDLVSTQPSELPAQGGAERRDEFAPSGVAGFGGDARRVDDVHEEHRGNTARGSVTQHTRSMPGSPAAGQDRGRLTSLDLHWGRHPSSL
jgi:hypothetical protein